MDFKEALAHKIKLENNVNDASKELRKYPKGEMGLIPDHIKFSPEYQADKRKYNAAFQALQTFNRYFVKAFKKEYKEYRAENRFNNSNL